MEAFAVIARTKKSGGIGMFYGGIKTFFEAEEIKREYEKGDQWKSVEIITVSYRHRKTPEETRQENE